MPEPDDDIEARVSMLEHEVARLREQAALTSSDAAAARMLAAGADHDVSEVRAELRAHTRALNALRETQLEQGRTLAEHSQILAEHSQAAAGLDEKMTDGFAKLGTGMTQITALLRKITDSEN
ncbi:MAG TPA: hypothetical protein VHH34_03560 [Pseudonocardiaceae bacterium]|nr:hypothetical protein [Pseudonocardiaceae bacterium]